MAEVSDIAREALGLGSELVCVVIRGLTNLTGRTFQLTDAVLQACIKKLLDHKAEHNGEKTLPTLLKEGAKLETIDVANADLKVFRKISRKYGVDFAIKKDIASPDGTHYVFFKSKDVEIMQKAFQEYTHVKLQKKPIARPENTSRKPIKMRLEEFKAIVQKQTAEFLKKRSPNRPPRAPRKAPGR